ncbi:MAG: GtrA family protein [Sphingopyxis sp.]|uniref:GtrA family protein n=1 Tax=Sphingopyxis sp. TaxID=1908224 RepID=UPI003D6DA17F
MPGEAGIAGLGQRLLARLHRITYLRYIGASAFALAADMGLFLLLLAGGWHAAAASAISYSAGIAVHWLISTRLVFVAGAQTRGIERARQKALFLGSALAGLGITVGIVWAGDAFGLDPRLAKLAAIAISFQTTYVLRKAIVFAGR